ncbi:MAG: hypothetical protein JNL97_16350, partial [Verrucomicrobiales bacterium]|nr:hypothetical protein [Verrucomicrobiales bacterium]
MLRELADRGGFRWIRSASPRVAQSGFEGISDVRLYVPRNRGLPESDRLPEDLFETYRMCRDALPGFEGSPRVWEIWNEPDFYFVRDSAADMAATLKAAWWGVKAARPDAEVLMPSLAFRPGRYAVELARNGVASWTDGWNVHFYGWAVDYSDFLVQHRAFAEAIGCRKPLWVTEIGYLGMPVSAAENPGAEAAQAAFHQRTMVDSRAYEVDRHLLFLLTPHAEARNELGLTTAEGRWRPALDQAARLAGHLREARPLFRLARRSDGESMGWVFETEDRAWWTVLWKPGRPGESAHPGGPVPSFSDATRPKFRWPADWVEIRVGLDGDVALVPSQIPEIELSADTVVHFRTPPERFGIEGCEWVPWPRTSSRSPRFPSPLRSELRGIPPVREPSP